MTINDLYLKREQILSECVFYLLGYVGETLKTDQPKEGLKETLDGVLSKLVLAKKELGKLESTYAIENHLIAKTLP